MELYFAAAIVTLLLSGFFSGIEIAYISANRLRIELLRKNGSRRGRGLAKLYEKPSEFLGTTLVGNNIALVIFSLMVGKILETLLFPQLPIALQNDFSHLLLTTILTTIVILIFGEFLPKVLFRLRAESILYFMTFPLTLIKLLLKPIVWVMVRLSYLVLRVFLGLQTQEVEQVFTRLDLEHFIKNISPESNEDIDTDLFENALYLPNIRVKECMIPRPEIVCVDINDGVEELKNTFINSHLSKILIYKETIDNILGYVHHQQMLKAPKDIQSMILPIPIVPGVMPARDMMDLFIKKQISIACVVDEFGGTAGIVTLEDILEEIVGEIEDEHDYDGDHLEKQINDREFLFSGRLEVDYLNDKYDLNLPEGEYHTLSGYLVTTTETIPKQGREFIFEPYKFVLESVSKTKIETVRVFILVKE